MHRFLVVPLLVGGLSLAVLLTGSTAAYADFKLCNMTASRIGVSIGWEEKGEWIAEGWWIIGSNACETILGGELGARFYYVYAQDYDRGGEWAGKSFMCTADKAFTIKGVEDCRGRGYHRKGFFEVDTQNAADWTVKLADPRETKTQ
jgi:uncharacterized membrane protein